MAKESNDNNFDPDRIKLTEAFGPILSRLKDLDNDITRLVPDHNTTGVLDNLSTVFLSVVPEKSLPFVGSCIERVERSIVNFKDKKDHLRSILEERNPVSVFANKERPNDIPDQVISQFEIELQSYMVALQSISSELSEVVDSFGNSRPVDRLPINLSTDDLAVLLELFQRARLIPKMPNTELAAIVSLHFSTKGAHQISAANFAKKLSLSNKSYVNVEEILRELLRLCRK